MSRIGKQPIPIPEKVEAVIDGNKIRIKGPKGELERVLPIEIKAEVVDGMVKLSLVKEGGYGRALWGLWRSLIAGMVKGVSEGFEKKLEIEGVGYRAEVRGKDLVLSLGFSHQVEVKAPEGIDFKVEKNIVIVSGFDKQLVGQVAAEVRSKRKPEPYKGTGIRYQGEYIRKKSGKKSVATEM